MRAIMLLQENGQSSFLNPSDCVIPENSEGLRFVNDYFNLKI